MIVEELAATFGLEIDEAAFTRAEQLLGGLRTGISGILGVVGGAVVAIGAAVAVTTTAGDQIGQVGDQLGMATQALQELQYAASLSDSSVEGLTLGVKHLAMQVNQAAQGSQEARFLFGKLGVTLHDTAGKIKAPDALLEDIADKFQKMPPGLERTGLAIQVFGRSGQELIPFLIQGKAGIQALRKEAEELGIVLSTDTVEQARAFHDDMERLGFAVRGLAFSIGGPLMHEFQDVTKALVHFISKNRELISAPIIAFFRALSVVIRFLASDTNAAKLVWDALKTLLAVKVLYAIKALEFGFGSLNKASVLAALNSAKAWVSATLPMLVMAGLLYLLADELQVFIRGGDTLLGRLIKWGETMNPNDGPGVKWLKTLVALLFDLTDPKKWEKVGEAFVQFVASNPIMRTLEGLGFFNPIKSIVGIGQKITGHGEQDRAEGKKNAKDVFDIQQAALHRKVYGQDSLTYTSPQGTKIRAGARLSEEEVATLNRMRQIIKEGQTPAKSDKKIEVNVHVKNANASPEQIGSHAKEAVKQALREHEDEQNRAAMAAQGSN